MASRSSRTSSTATSSPMRAAISPSRRARSTCLRQPGPDVGRAHEEGDGHGRRGLRPGELSVLHLNVDVKPLNDMRVRQAIAHAIDRTQIVSSRADTARRRPVDRAHPAISDRRDVPLPPTISRRRRRCSRRQAIRTGSPSRCSTPTCRRCWMTAVLRRSSSAGINLDWKWSSTRPTTPTSART